MELGNIHLFSAWSVTLMVQSQKVMCKILGAQYKLLFLRSPSSLLLCLFKTDQLNKQALCDWIDMVLTRRLMPKSAWMKVESSLIPVPGSSSQSHTSTSKPPNKKFRKGKSFLPLPEQIKLSQPRHLCNLMPHPPRKGFVLPAVFSAIRACVACSSSSASNFRVSRSFSRLIKVSCS